MIMRIVDNGMMLEYDPVKFFNENDLNPEKKLEKMNAMNYEQKVQFVIDNVDPEVIQK
jgi:hypothetical protein